MTDFATNAREACNAIADMLIAKNKAYGDSALNPIRVFSKGDPSEGIRLRIDDKLSRIARGEAAGEDTITDLIGYLIMLQIAERKAGSSSPFAERKAGPMPTSRAKGVWFVNGVPAGEVEVMRVGEAVECKYCVRNGVPCCPEHRKPSEPIDGDCMAGAVSGVKTYPAGDKPAWCTKPGWNGIMVADLPRAGTSRIDLEAFKRHPQPGV